MSRYRISAAVPQFILRCGQDDKGNVFWFSAREIDFSLLRNFETRSGAKLVSYSVDPGVNFSEEKVAGLCKVDSSIPSSVEANNECSYTPPYGFMACAGNTSEGLKYKDRTKQFYLSTAMETPILVAARSKAKVCDRSLTGTVGSNTHGGTAVCLLDVVFVRYRSLRRAIPRLEESYRVFVCVCVCVCHQVRSGAIITSTPAQSR